MGKKSQSDKPIPVEATETEAAPVVEYSVPDAEPAIESPIGMEPVNALRAEINAKLPELRNLADTQPIVFFCDEILRALNGLESNTQSYCEKRLLEARKRAATGQGAGK